MVIALPLPGILKYILINLFAHTVMENNEQLNLKLNFFLTLYMRQCVNYAVLVRQIEK